MNSRLLAIAGGLVLLGIVGFIAFTKVGNSIKSSAEEINPNYWHVKLDKSDGYVNTGIPIDDHSLIQISETDDNGALVIGQDKPPTVSWITRINNTPKRGTGLQSIMACVREQGEIANLCLFVPEGHNDTVYLKNDSTPQEITVYVMVIRETRHYDKEFPK